MKHVMFMFCIAGIFAQTGCNKKAVTETHPALSTAVYEPQFQRNPAEELKEFLSGDTGYDTRPAVMIDANGREIQTPTVKDVVDAAHRGYNAQGGSEFRTQLYFLAIEQQLRLLISAKPSKHSYVREFRCTRDFVDQLPDTAWEVMVYNVPGNTGKGDPARIVPSGKRFVDIRKPEAVQVSSNADAGIYQTITIRFLEQPNETYFDDAGEILLSFLGWGDFNGDGYEDIIFSVAERTHQGTAGRTYSVGELILTKLKPTDVWKVVTLNGH